MSKDLIVKLAKNTIPKSLENSWLIENLVSNNPNDKNVEIKTFQLQKHHGLLYNCSSGYDSPLIALVNFEVYATLFFIYKSE